MSELFALLGHKSAVVGLSFSADDRLLASAGSNDATVRIWGLAEGMELDTLACGKDSPVSCVTFAPDAKTLISGEPDRVRVWDVQSAKELASWKEDSTVNAVAFAPDGATFAAGLRSGKVKMFDTATRKERHCFEEHNGEVFSLAYSPDGKVLASGGRAEVRLWDVALGKQRLGPKLSDWEGREIVGLAFSPDGKSVFCARAYWKDGLRRWDITARKPVEAFQPPTLGEANEGNVQYLALSPDGKVLAVPIASGRITFLSADTGELLATVKGHSGWGTCVAFAPDGKRLASGGYEGSVKLWDVAKSLR